MNILIVPCDRPLPNSNTSAKSYPFWDELITYLESHNHTVHIQKY